MNTHPNSMYLSSIYAKFMRKDTFWTYEDAWGEISDSEYKTRGDAVIAANNDFCQFCDENVEECINGMVRSEECMVYHYFYNSQGERVCIGAQEITVEWEFYHGDYQEHGTHWRGI